jgi:hypothetical protein
LEKILSGAVTLSRLVVLDLALGTGAEVGNMYGTGWIFVVAAYLSHMPRASFRTRCRMVVALVVAYLVLPHLIKSFGENNVFKHTVNVKVGMFVVCELMRLYT